MLVITVSPRLRRWFIVGVGLLLLVGVGRWALAPAGILPAAGRYHPLRRAEAVPGSEVALTFNLYWGEEVPTEVLDVLAEEDVRATFFVTAPWAESHPDLLGRIVHDGHEIGNGGCSYVNLCEYGREYVREQIHRGGTTLESLSGQRPTYFRPPNGNYNDDVITLAMDLGYKVVLWSIDSHDWMNPGVGHVVDRVLEGAGPGDVILFHANDPPGDTVPALREIISGLKSRGNDMVTLQDLLGGGN